VAASNRDLRQEAADVRFRLDLFYRLGVFPVDVPPLRERREDIPELAAYCVRQACMRFHVAEPRLIQRMVARWERGEMAMRPAMDKLVRLSVAEADRKRAGTRKRL